MGPNLLLLLAMVTANLLSLYHLSSNLQSQQPQTPPVVPDHLIRQLSTIRATINHLTRHQQDGPTTKRQTTSSSPSDLLLYSSLGPIASSCRDHPHLLRAYMNYTPFSPCPRDSNVVAESLILRGCSPLPRRRCFSSTPHRPTSTLDDNPFPVPLSDSNVIWDDSLSPCRRFKCLNPKLGFDMGIESKRFLSYNSESDLTIPQLMKAAEAAGSVLRLGIDIGGGTGTFAVRMKQRNVTVVTTTMNLGAPYNEVAALRGVVPLHVPLQQRIPIFDGVLDLVRCGHAVNRWIPVVMMEFLLGDLDRVLRGGGFLWLDHFFSKGSDLEKVYKPLIGRLGYRIVKWAAANKTDSKNGEVYLTALLQKPKSRS
ncbi:hypothetical protein Droror1_Dr00016377 [Drosera rotundifolia]